MVEQEFLGGGSTPRTKSSKAFGDMDHLHKIEYLHNLHEEMRHNHINSIQSIIQRLDQLEKETGVVAPPTPEELLDH